jgi:hypothetical protein
LPLKALLGTNGKAIENSQKRKYYLLKMGAAQEVG